MVDGMNTQPSPIILELWDMSFAYPGERALWSGWSASIGTGITQLYGDTGSGKSTLLQILAGRLPAKGRMTLTGIGFERNPDAYRRRVFFPDHANPEFDQMTGRACTVALMEGNRGFDPARWSALVEGFSLTPHIDKPLYMLSTGSRRKVWLAAGLASGLPLTLLDEPTAGLDGPSIGCLWLALAEMSQASDRAFVVASSERIDRAPITATVTLPLS